MRITTPEELQHAVYEAQKAFTHWKQAPASQRARILFRYQQLLVENEEELTHLISLETGKSEREAQREVEYGIECVEFAATVPALLQSESATGLIRSPLGVIGGIAPPSFPMMIPCWMFPLAIVCGNTFVLKPSEQTPLLAIRLAELMTTAGLPPGVLHVVHGAPPLIDALLEHPSIQAITFAGSFEKATSIHQTARQQGKRVQALASAKRHAIVLPDADLEQVVQTITRAAFGLSGESEFASAVIAVGEIANPLVRRIHEAADAIATNQPSLRLPSTQRTLALISSGEREGAHLIRDGRQDHTKDDTIGPTVFDHVTPEMSIWQETATSPILLIARVSSLDEAITLTNRSDFAHSVCLYTDSVDAIRRFYEESEASIIGINLDALTPSLAFQPLSEQQNGFYSYLLSSDKERVEFCTRKKRLLAAK